MSTGALADDRDPLPETPFPPGASAHRARLPAALTPLIGREHEIERALTILRDDSARLVTLTGLGGVGKTRLAIETAARVAGDFAEGTLFVPLAAVQDPQLVGPTIAQALDVQGASDLPPSEQLHAALRDRQLLLVLDNFEHLLPAATLVIDLLTACPRLKILATSRIRLRLSGEHEVPVPPLDTVNPARLPDIDELRTVPAISLFLERAHAANPSFALTPANAVDVAGICRRLDGLPLAIELAAAWSSLLSPQGMLARLEQRLYLLTGGPSDAPARLQSMRAAISGSYELLAPTSQELFQQLSIFVGGCTIDAAEAVCARSDGGSVLEGVKDLVEKGLIQTTVNAIGEPRFVMLETIREFGLEQLAASGAYDLVLERHSAWFRHFADYVSPGLEAPDSHVWLRRVDADIDNLRMTLTKLRDQGRIEDALKLAVALDWAWTTPGYHAEGHAWFEELLDLAGDRIDQTLLARAYNADGGILAWQSKFTASAKRNEQALAIWREVGNEWLIGSTLRALGTCALGDGDLDQAEALFEEARPISIRVNDHWNIAAVTNSFGRIAGMRGDWRSAIAWHEEALGLWRRRGDTTYVVTALTELAWAQLQVAEHRRAWETYEAALSLALEINHEYEIAFSLIGFAWLAAEYDQAAAAARLFACSNTVLERINIPVWPQDPELIARKWDEVHTTLGTTAFYEHAHAGSVMSIAEATALALTVVVPEPDTEHQTGLTPREREVLQLVVDGASDHEIADHLFITRRTASKHVAAIIEKLGVANRTAAATAAVRRRLI